MITQCKFSALSSGQYDTEKLTLLLRYGFPAAPEPFKVRPTPPENSSFDVAKLIVKGYGRANRISSKDFHTEIEIHD